MALYDLRYFIDLIEGKNRERDLSPWEISVTPLFAPSLMLQIKRYSDLKEKLDKFVEVKKENPLIAKFGRNDYPFTGALVGFWHAHLKEDAIIIYNLKNRCINLICVVSHTEIEGRREKQVLKQIDGFR